MRALVIIDMQQWMFRTPARLDQIPVLTANTNALARVFEAARLPIFDLRTEHKPDRSTWSRLMRKYDYPCLIEGTADAAPVAGFDPPKAIKIVKTANSAFLGTDFAARLEDNGVTDLVLAGVFIDGCVGLTAAEAAQRGYEVTFIADAIGHVDIGRRGTILDWLVTDYELKAQSTAELVREMTQLGRA